MTDQGDMSLHWEHNPTNVLFLNTVREDHCRIKQIMTEMVNDNHLHYALCKDKQILH